MDSGVLHLVPTYASNCVTQNRFSCPLSLSTPIWKMRELNQTPDNMCFLNCILGDWFATDVNRCF